MAATINIYCVFSDALNIVSILQELKDNKLVVNVDKKFSMDNWCWENQQQIQNFSEVDSLLQNQKIIVINAYLYPFKDFGIYIEKSKAKYIYEFWINTEGFPELDSDIINLHNIGFFEKMEKIIMRFIEKHIATFEMISIGNEMVFNYHKNIAETIRETDSALIWFIPKVSEDGITIKGYSKNVINGVEVFIKNN